jgi:DNA replication and repair protein RecF
MAEAGTALSDGRARLVAALTEALAELPREPFALPELTYQAGGAAHAATWRSARARDRAAARTLEGPHRDDLGVSMAGKGHPADRCSTGEQKAMLIAITLAHAGLAARGRAGALLLDEVAAHLDPVRREALFERLGDSGTQVWFTGTETAPFAPILGDAAVWRVSAGAVRREN